MICLKVFIGPLLFLVYINGVTDIFSIQLTIYLYADNFKISLTHGTKEKLDTQILGY